MTARSNKVRTVLILVISGILGFTCPANAGEITYVPITGDADSGISTDNSYTHTIDFGTGTPGASINGIQFDAYNAGANGTLNFNREVATGLLSDHGGNGNHNVTGGLVDLLTDMYYNGNNAAGGTRTWTLGGLTPGKTYHTRIYTRQWGASDARTVTFVFDPDGPGHVSDSSGVVSQDNASSVGFANGNDAFYINYQFKAVAGQDLVISLTQDNTNQSWHLYGLSNQEFSSETAVNPSPAHEATDVLRDANLSWEPGDFAVTHDVYLGESLEDVDTATEATASGLDVNSLDLDRLELGKTYYWRVDEVNGAPDKTVFKGDVWSFTVEPLSIPVGTVTATASSSNNEAMGPENTLNGIGLNELDQHSTEPTDMWLSGVGDPTPSIQYEFDQAYKLHEMLVWNSNQLIESFIGLGAKDVMIEYSVDGTDWTTLDEAGQFAQAPGKAHYTANTMVDFAGALAQYVRITINGGHGMLPQYGLSEVRFLYIPTFARTPQPADGEAIEGVDVAFSWRAGREATAHELYLGTDPADLALAATTNDSAFFAEDLDYDRTYYWQVIEINETETPAAYAGPIWQISTPAYGVVDDFDLHDDVCKRIFFAWEDGLGHNGGEGIEGCDQAPSAGNGGGSIVGNAAAPFAEQLLVYAGTQSMPLDYDNAFGASEATLTIPSQNWAGSGIKTLSLMVFGHPDNTGQLYVKINNTKVVYEGDTAIVQEAQWLPWHIDLSAVGGPLSNVTGFTIGIEGANAAGKLYIDSIRLYPQVREFAAPVFSFVKITGDEDCGITADNTYTHALDLGQGTPGALINGVQFAAYNSAANGSLNFTREVSSGALSDHGGNGAHNVSGALVDLLTDMYYNGSTAPGGTSTWTLSGLTAGQTYNTRIYTRQWGATDNRTVTFVFDPDGAGPISDSTGRASQDNAISRGFANDNDAYYINYRFTAVEGEDLVITVTQHISTYSWHLYGLTNQEVAGE
jgi:hypothetical protein